MISFISCNSKKKESEKIVEKNIEIAEIEPKVVEEKVEEPKKEMNYYLVAGCFVIESNAEKYNKQLIKEGYDSCIVPFYGMNMVTYDGFATKDEAQRALNMIVQEAGKENTWVYPLK